MNVWPRCDVLDESNDVHCDRPLGHRGPHRFGTVTTTEDKQWPPTDMETK